MVLSRERAPREQETLVFETPEQAEAWRSQALEKLTQERSQGGQRQREVVGEMLADEFAKEGEGVEMIRQPWEHTPAEHAEVQELVDRAFASDLGAVIREARASKHYPRNLDLFHDVLTGEMYQLVVKEGLSKQPVGRWITVVLILVILTVVGLFMVWWI